MNGIINIYKEPGFTSADVVAKLRGILHQKKIGHTGTLDPAAEGVLPVCIGNGTRVCELITDWDKEYEAVLILGVTTDTLDMEGTVLSRADQSELEKISENQVFESVRSFVGKIQQVPPMYSALKVNGQRLYDLARQGIEVERKAREITIFSIDILDVKLPRVTMRVKCSKGTYIRSLCQDIGESLGVGGAMEHLTRTRVGCFGIETAVRLNDLEKAAHNATYETGQWIVRRNEKQKELAVDEDKLIIDGNRLICPVDQVFEDLPKACVCERFIPALKNGNKLYSEWLDFDTESDRYRLYDEQGRFYAIYERGEDNFLKPVKMFL